MGKCMKLWLCQPNFHLCVKGSMPISILIWSVWRVFSLLTMHFHFLCRPLALWLSHQSNLCTDWVGWIPQPIKWAKTPARTHWSCLGKCLSIGKCLGALKPEPLYSMSRAGISHQHGVWFDLLLDFKSHISLNSSCPVLSQSGSSHSNFSQFSCPPPWMISPPFISSPPQGTEIFVV